MSVLGRPMLVVASSLFLGACSQPTQPVTAEPLADSTSASSTQHGGVDKARLAYPQWLPTERVAEQAGADVKAGRIATMDEALYGVCAGPPDEVLYP